MEVKEWIDGEEDVTGVDRMTRYQKALLFYLEHWKGNKEQSGRAGGVCPNGDEASHPDIIRAIQSTDTYANGQL